MSLLQRVCKTLGVVSLAAAVPLIAVAQSSFVKQAGEYAPLGSLAGDQVRPSLALSPSGGWVVYHDNITDGDGYGISAQRLDGTFSPSLSPFRVNQQGADDQENPQVSLLNNGGAVFVWQGGPQSFQHIYARFLSANNTFATGDIQVNAATNFYQTDPVVTTLPNGNLAVAWVSFGQEGGFQSLQGVYARLLTPAGQPMGGEFQVNQVTAFNQRTPAIASLSNGNFVMAWVSEQQSYTNSVEVFARIFNSTGLALTGEIRVNSSSNVCANPSVAGASDGTFIVTWGERNPGALSSAVRNNGWDVFARPFSATGSPGVVHRINTQLYGDQYAPKISSLGAEYLVAWTSVGQDGSREGIFGQFLHGDASANGGEFGINTTSLNQQIHPAVASDSAGRFLVVWSSFGGGVNSMDLNAQRFVSSSQILSPPGAPFVEAISSGTLQVTWPAVAGFNVVNYDLYVDGSEIPSLVTSNLFSLGGLAAGSSHTFRLDYVLDDGRRSPLSVTVSATTWGADGNNDGLPDDWEALYYGTNSANWPSAGKKLAADGTTVGLVFQMGGNPLDPTTWLKPVAKQTSQGVFLTWPTQPGSVYQVLSASSANGIYSNFGTPRLAAGTSDSVFLGLSNHAGYFRLMRIRY